MSNTPSSRKSSRKSSRSQRRRSRASSSSSSSSSRLQPDATTTTPSVSEGLRSAPGRTAQQQVAYRYTADGEDGSDAEPIDVAADFGVRKPYTIPDLGYARPSPSNSFNPYAVFAELDRVSDWTVRVVDYHDASFEPGAGQLVTFTAYTIQVGAAQGSWRVARRFASFAELDRLLRRQAGDRKRRKALPALPSARWILPATRRSKRYLDQRQRQLQQYLQDAQQVDVAWQSRDFMAFLLPAADDGDDDVNDLLFPSRSPDSPVLVALATLPGAQSPGGAATSATPLLHRVSAASPSWLLDQLYPEDIKPLGIPQQQGAPPAYCCTRSTGCCARRLHQHQHKVWALVLMQLALLALLTRDAVLLDTVLVSNWPFWEIVPLIMSFEALMFISLGIVPLLTMWRSPCRVTAAPLSAEVLAVWITLIQVFILFIGLVASFFVTPVLRDVLPSLGTPLRSGLAMLTIAWRLLPPIAVFYLLDSAHDLPGLTLYLPLCRGNYFSARFSRAGTATIWLALSSMSVLAAQIGYYSIPDDTTSSAFLWLISHITAMVIPVLLIAIALFDPHVASLHLPGIAVSLTSVLLLVAQASAPDVANTGSKASLLFVHATVVAVTCWMLVLRLTERRRLARKHGRRPLGLSYSKEREAAPDVFVVHTGRHRWSSVGSSGSGSGSGSGEDDGAGVITVAPAGAELVH